MKDIKEILRYASYLVPAGVAGCLVIAGLSTNTPVFDAIPTRLVMPETVLAAEETIEEEPTTAAVEETTLAVSDATYPDGTYTGSAQGYGGTVSVRVTVEGGKITAVDILDASGETDSFFQRAKAVIDSVLATNTWEVDVVSGATYSSRGILGAIQNALTGEAVVTETPAATEAPQLVQEEFTASGTYKDGTYNGSAQGFGGTIQVAVTISGGKIQNIQVLSASGETPSYWSRATAVIQRILNAGSPNVDTVSGATYSSNGIINAVKRALNQAAQAGGTYDDTDETQSPAKPTQAERPTKDDSAEAPTIGEDSYYKDGTYRGTGFGFGGDVVVDVVIRNGEIASVKAVSAADETPEYWNRAKVLLDQIQQKKSVDVDVVSGATYSSEGILDAVKEALSKAIVRKETEAETESSTEIVSESESETETETTEVVEGERIYRDGTYQGIGYGYGGDVVVEITIENDRITFIQEISADDETPVYWNRAKLLMGKILQEQSTDVDVISGATYSSEGILDAVKDALAKARIEEETPEETETEEETSSESEEESTQEPEAARYDDGTYWAEVPCVSEGIFDYIVRVDVLIEGGVIQRIDWQVKEDKSAEPDANLDYMDYAVNGRTRRGVTYVGVLDQIFEKQSAEGIDAVSGATYSSQALIRAMQLALEVALPSSSEETTETTERTAEESLEETSLSYSEESTEESLEGMLDEGNK